jgi:protease-4
MRKIIIGIAIGLALIIIAFGLGFCSYLAKIGSSGKGSVGLIKVEGTIMMSTSVVEQLEKARKDPKIKAVVVRLDTPGGAVAASQEIFEEVKKVDGVKPVIASMGNVAASGGYYIACGARRIFANQGTLTGSIGVRMEHINIGELLNWAKVSHETLKSGYFKDIGAFDRPMTDEERALLQGFLTDLHAQFKETVATSRNIPIEEVEKLSDGRIFSGEEAVDLKLVDEIGGLTDAVKFAYDAAGLKGEPEYRILEKKKTFFMKILSEETMSFLKSAGSALAVYKF